MSLIDNVLSTVNGWFNPAPQKSSMELAMERANQQHPQQSASIQMPSYNIQDWNNYLTSRNNVVSATNNLNKSVASAQKSSNNLGQYAGYAEAPPGVMQQKYTGQNLGPVQNYTQQQGRTNYLQDGQLAMQMLQQYQQQQQVSHTPIQINPPQQAVLPSYGGSPTASEAYLAGYV